MLIDSRQLSAFVMAVPLLIDVYLPRAGSDSCYAPVLGMCPVR